MLDDICIYCFCVFIWRGKVKKIIASFRITKRMVDGKFKNVVNSPPTSPSECFAKCQQDCVDFIVYTPCTFNQFRFVRIGQLTLCAVPRLLFGQILCARARVGHKKNKFSDRLCSRGQHAKLRINRKTQLMFFAYFHTISA